MIETQVVGMEEVKARLNLLKLNIQKKALRRGITKISRLITKSAKAKAPKEIGGKGSLARARAGTYRKSIGQKVKTYSNGAVVGIIGARKGFRKQIGVRVRGANKGQPIFHDPAKIGHLIELGHGGPAPAGPHPHLRPALNEHKGAPAVRIIGEEVNVEINAMRIK